jgi:hypothetical protein
MMVCHPPETSIVTEKVFPRALENRIEQFGHDSATVIQACAIGKRKGHPATGRPLLQGRIVPTEALDSVKTFCGNLMSLKTGVSSDFSEINASVFNDLQKTLTFLRNVPK